MDRQSAGQLNARLLSENGRHLLPSRPQAAPLVLVGY